MFFRLILKVSGILLLIVVILFSRQNSSAANHESCGTLVQGTNCILFLPDGSPGYKFVLDNYDSFSVGEEVFVSGNLEYGCTTECLDASGCIIDNSIVGDCGPGMIIRIYGKLIQGADCILFATRGSYSSQYVLDDYGEFQVGDEVFVTGILATGCITECSDADGCIENNTINSTGLPGHDYIPGQITLKLEEGLQVEPHLINFEGIAIDTIENVSTFLISFPEIYPVDEIINTLLNQTGVISAQLNYLLGVPESFQMSESFPDESPNSFERGYTPLPFYQQQSVTTLILDSTHMLSTGQNIIVAIIDNGIDFSHPVFSGTIAETGYDFIDLDDYPGEEPGDLYGHGSFIAGLILLAAPDCKLIPIRAFDENGLSNSYYVAKAIYYAINHGADVIIMSFGMYTSNLLLETAVQDATDAGITMIAAAGNEGVNLATYPAGYPGVIGVSAIDPLDYITSFSNFGGFIDVCAPGENLYSALIGDHDWGWWSGTSFSAALVAGVSAAILEAEPTLSPFDMEEGIRRGARKELQWGVIVPPDEHYGYGCVDALNAVIEWRIGDVNESKDINILDIVYLIDYKYKNGPLPMPIEKLGDVNCTGTINILDVVKLINYLYKEGERPSCP